MQQKVGLITFHDTTNFGSLLQTYGLYRGIETLGAECEVIDYQCESIVERELPKNFSLKWPIKKMLLHILFDEKHKKYKELCRFLTSKMNLSPKCNKNTVKSLNGRYDRFVVGSDIVWGLDITKGDTAYFLDFVTDNKQKCAFSSSIGNPWSNEEKVMLKPFLSAFNYIAVREDESADWVNELTDNRPEVVCDPTMLVKSEEWIKLKSDTYASKKYVLVYFNDSKSNCLNDAKKYAAANGLDVYFINYGKPIKGVKSIRPYSLEDFLSLFYYAQRTFTASYHGMLFSIYFNKQFLYYNRAHKSRMNTLARKLNVSQCEGGNMNINNIPTVDYLVVNTAVETYREHSFKCLQQLLNA